MLLPNPGVVVDAELNPPNPVDVVFWAPNPAVDGVVLMPPPYTVDAPNPCEAGVEENPAVAPD